MPAIHHHHVLPLISGCLWLSFATSCVLYEEAPPYSPTPCKVNEYVQQGACTQCPEGTSRPAGDAINKGDTACLPVTCQENQRVSSNACVPCKPGEINEAGDDASGLDTLCQPVRCAMNQRVENNQCVECNLGTLNTAGDLANGANTQCDGLICSENQYVNQNMCLTCEPGTVRPAGDDASKEDTMCAPLICKANQRVQSNQCKPCPVGTTSQAGADASGQDTECQPVLCSKNQYVSTNMCLPCPAGSTRPAGDPSNGVDTQCSPTLCEVNQRVQSNACVPCEDKRINEPGDDATGPDTQCVPFAFSSISTGLTHTCGVTVTGGVKCWGDNEHKQIGVDTVTRVNRPVDVPGLADVVMVSAGRTHTCAVLKSGKVACWGENFYKQLGVDSSEDTSKPVIVPNINNATKVSLGEWFSCALDGQEIKCWGDKRSGKLGDGEETGSRAIPTKVMSESSFTDLDVKRSFVCGLTSTGEVECWGDNSAGQLGIDPLVTKNSPVPVQVIGVDGGAKAISVGATHLYVIFHQDIKCVGNNGDGQCGSGDDSNASHVLRTVSTTNVFKFISAGHGHTCGLNRRGGVSCWGSNKWGQLGNDSTKNSNVPVWIETLASGVTDISTGSRHTCVVDNLGSASCWGANSFGELGIGPVFQAWVPTKVLP